MRPAPFARSPPPPGSMRRASPPATRATVPDTLIRAANDLADRMGVRATPTFFVNGRRVEGALPAEQFRAVLMDALRPSRGN